MGSFFEIFRKGSPGNMYPDMSLMQWWIGDALKVDCYVKSVGSFPDLFLSRIWFSGVEMGI